MRFSILGPLEVCADGRAASLGGIKPRALLAMLLLHANQPVSAEQLALGLWGDDAPAGAVKTVQVYVSRLRQALGDPDVLATTPAGYQLRVGARECDLERFEQQVAEGRRALAADDAERAAAVLRDALALWRGAPLVELAAVPFASAESARLEEQRLAALELRVEADLAAGRHDELIPELQQLAHEHPWHERLHAQHMLALYRSGRQADALDAYRHAREVLVDELGIEPGPELRQLERDILGQAPSLSAPARAHDVLPVLPNATLGRERELAQASSLMRGNGVRLLTLTGPGGVGKTRLALELAHRLAPEFVDGGYFVGLAATARAEHVAAAIARAIGVVPVAGESSERALVRHVARRHCLLVLDNLEHLVDVGPEISELLSAAAGVQLLVTSRRPLRLTGETVLGVPPLSSADAVALFTERVGAAGHDVPASPADAAAVAELCGRLDGLPLAIELAAARMGVLSPRALLGRLDQRFELLASGPRDAPTRQRTLLATIDWSHELLVDRERAMLRRLSVFAGGCTLEAVQHVCDGERLIDTLASLVDHSLLRRTVDGEGETRLEMLETIREYATARLAASGEEDETRQRHAEYFSALADRLEPDLVSSRDSAVLDRLEREHDNLRVALDWAGAAGRGDLQLRLTGALYWFWFVRGHVNEGLRRLDAALDATAPGDAARANALRGRAMLRAWLDRVDEAEADARELVELAERADDAELRIYAMNSLGLVAQQRGDYDRARQMHERVASLSRDAGDRLSLCVALGNLADIALNQERFQDAAALSSEELEIARGEAHLERVATTLGNLGSALLALGRPRDAAERFTESLRHSRDIGAIHNVGYALEGLAAAAAALHEPRRAACLVGAANASFRTVDMTLQSFEARRHEDLLARLRNELGPDALADALAEGGKLTLDAAAALASGNATANAGERQPHQRDPADSTA